MTKILKMLTTLKMKVYNVEQKTEKWHELRQGRVTGTVLKRILGTPKVREGAFYEIIAERLSTEANSEESAMDRGVRLEGEAIEAYEAQKGVKVQRIGFTSRDDSKWIASSPDGLIEANGRYSKAVEVKCLSSANHIKAWLTQEVPEDYLPQGLNYFLVNDECEEVDFVFYDPRISKIPFFIITLKREDYVKEIEDALVKVKQFIHEVDEVVKTLI